MSLLDTARGLFKKSPESVVQENEAFIQPSPAAGQEDYETDEIREKVKSLRKHNVCMIGFFFSFSIAKVFFLFPSQF
jgi:hypothetical protein